MASGVNVKMGVTGVAQFKQSMKESQAAVKNLDQQLKLNEAQLKLTGNEELALENKTALLTKQIEEQKNVVKQANSALEAMQRNGVSKTSTEFQKMQQQVYKASTDLMNMQAELQGVGETGEEAQSGVSHMNQALQRIGTNVSFENVVNGISKVTDGLEAAAQKAVQLGKKLIQAMLSGGQWADDLQTTADKWEMSPEQVYRMQQTAYQIDTDAETIFQARQKLIAAMGKESDKETMGAFAALGITNLTGSDENIENVFWRAGQGLMQMQDKVARNEYAMKLYGRSWTELIPIFKAGRETYEETMASWTWIGDQQFENLTKLDDEEKRLTSEWENFQHQFEAALAPAMTSVMETLEGLLHEFNEYLASPEGQQMLESLGEAVSGLFSDLATIDPEQVVSGIVDLFTKIKEGLQWVIDNKQHVVDALKIIAGGFAVLKLTEIATNIGRIVSGLGGLFGWKNGTNSTAGNGTGTQPVPTNTKPVGQAAGANGGKLVELGNAATTIASKGAAALTMYDPTGSLALLPYVMKDFTTFGRTLARGGSVGEAAGNSWETIKASFNQAVKNWTEYPQQLSDSLHNFNGWLSQQIWGDYDSSWMPETSPFAENLQDYYYEPMDRMTEVAGEQNEILPGVQQSSENMTNAATELMGLPDLIRTAVISGMSSVTIIIDQAGVDAMQPRIAGGISDKLVQMTK